MTLAHELDRAWRTLEAGDARNGLLRSLEDFGVRESRMMLGIEDGCRELLFPAPDELSLTSLHRTRGVKVALRTLGAGKSMQRHLVLRCTSPDFHGVFGRFAGAILEQVAASREPARACLEAMRAWQEMFLRAGPKSEATLQGIFGELDELRGLVKRSPDAVAIWTGPDARPQDFIRGPLALEVKSIRSLASSVEIHGLEQLWASPYERLVLVVKQIVTDPAGERIGDVVAELLRDGASAELLDERLGGFDLDQRQTSAPDQHRFVHRGSRYYLVTKDAPALTPDLLKRPLPVGIARLRYAVALDSPGLEPMSPDAVDSFLSRLSGR